MTEPNPKTRLRAALLALVLAGSLACSAASAQTAAPPKAAAASAAERGGSRSGDYIVAVVNTELVTSVEVAQRLERALAEARRAGGPAPDMAALRKQVLDSLIDERVLVTYARDSGVRIDDVELDRAVANVAAQNQLSVDQLRDRLKAEGMDYRRFRSSLRDQLLVERVREREVGSRIRVTDNDIDRLLEEHKARAAAQSQLDIGQILIAVPEGASPTVVAERKARAESVLAKLRAGEDFAAVARASSDDPGRENGGATGMKDADRLPDLFVDSVRNLAVGDLVAQPVRSGAGFHVLKLLGRQQADPFMVTQTQARHILLRTSEQAPAAAVARRLEDIRQQIERGDRKFENVAREISEDGSAAAGGDLGWGSPGQFVPEFEDAMNRLPVGGISAPVVSRFGVHLIQVVARRDAHLEPKEVRNQARNQLRELKYGQAFADWVKELKLRAYIEMREPPQ